jgi:osmotically-inducible protein OsmY
MKIKKNSSIGNRSSKALLKEIWSCLKKVDTIRSLEMNDISIDITNGEVLLLGHLANDGHKQRIESIVSEIPGVTIVKNRLIGDRELKGKVAQALAKDARTRPFFIYVGAFHGWVHISGKVPLAQGQEVVEEVAASIPEVRGIVTLPNLEKGEIADKHHVVQPLVDTKVYDRTNPPGLVYKVVIDPQNRLVVGAIVEEDLQENGGKEKCYFVIPSKFMRVANEGGVTLENSFLDMTSSPRFNHAEYMDPPEDWHPPFPYKPGEVLWPKGVSNV